MILTGRQWVGLPVLYGIPILALTGVLGPGRGGFVLRMAAVYVLVLACFRVIGKRELGEMSPVEIVTLIFVPQLFRNAIMHSDQTLLSGIVAAFTLFALVFTSSLLAYHVPAARRLLLPGPSVLVRDGEPDERVLDRERVTRDDILASARKVGLATLEEVRCATLEDDGQISIVPSARAPFVPTVDR